MKNSVPANWIAALHQPASLVRGPGTRLDVCQSSVPAAAVKKIEPTKKTAASAPSPTSWAKPGNGPTKKQSDPIAKPIGDPPVPDDRHRMRMPAVAGEPVADHRENLPPGTRRSDNSQSSLRRSSRRFGEIPPMSAHHHDHNAGEIEDHDRGLSHDLPILISRRRALGVIGGGVGLVLAGCSSDDDKAATTERRDATTDDRNETTSSSDTSAVPEETAGPYPGDGSNGPNVLTESGVVRSDITKSFGDASGTAAGVPTTVDLTLIDVAGGGGPLAGAAVYLWHCNIDGQYSLYDQAIADQNYLRGVQESDDDGKLSFTTIFPAAYSGRWPHIHFEVYENLDAATAAKHEAAHVPDRAARGRLQRRVRDGRLRAERGEPQADLARDGHGLQRRLREPARDGDRQRRGRHHAEPQRRRVSDRPTRRRAPR